jgi:hypothetical protein
MRSISAIAKAAGLVKAVPNQNLTRAKAAFQKITPEQRADFLKWMKSEGREQND